MIARAFLLKPRVIVADEPVSMVDASIRSMILDLMLQLKREVGVSFLYITHDLSTAYQIGDEIIGMLHDLPCDPLQRAEAHRIVPLPQSARVAERGDPGLGRDARSREGDDVPSGQGDGCLPEAQWFVTNAMNMKPMTLNAACAAMFATMFPRRSYSQARPNPTENITSGSRSAFCHAPPG